MNNARVALYARVSTLHNGQDPEVQLRELRQYCTHRGWQMAGEYVDKSGATPATPTAPPKMTAITRKATDFEYVEAKVPFYAPGGRGSGEPLSKTCCRRGVARAR